MKNIIKNAAMCLLGVSLLSSCSSFEDINVDPTQANGGQTKVEYVFNKALVESHPRPDFAERVFIITWKSLARQMPATYNVGIGASNDGFEGMYFSGNADWQNLTYTTIKLADTKIEEGKLSGDEALFVPRVKQVSRIWRANLMAEFMDIFGTTSLNAFQGFNPDYNSVEEGYDFVFKELTDAVNQLETLPSGGVSNQQAKYDVAYGFNFDKWVRYANSLRMRYAMRISKVDPERSKQEFEAAIGSGKFITDASFNFKVKEEDGWNPLFGAMARDGYVQQLSTTLSNIYVGLGGVKSVDLLADSLHQYVKEADYLGVQYKRHYTEYSNDPMNGFWLDGLPYSIDPRAYKMFYIPGDLRNENNYGYYHQQLRDHVRPLMDPDNEEQELLKVNGKFTWNAKTLGSHGKPGVLNKALGYNGTTPGMTTKYRKNTGERLWFASWETYFLIAEAALEWGGSFAGLDAKSAYEKAIGESFAYHEVDAKLLSSYLASEDYSRVGTSVSWTHTAEPTPTKSMRYVDGYTKVAGTTDYKYPETSKTLYGKALNDQYVKLYTQKYIANMPWFPVEAWSDQRKMGLPFFETPAVESAIPTMPALTRETVFGKQQTEFFPQRHKFPSNFVQNNTKGYDQAVEHLGGVDNVYTKIWWANY